MKKSNLILKQFGILIIFFILSAKEQCYAQQPNPSAKDIQIVILKDYNYTNNDSLILDSLNTVDVYKGRKITWVLGSEAKNVKKFTIEDKPSYKDPFALFDKPSGFKGTKKSGKIKSKTDQTYYEYSIIWVDKNGKEHKFDPKISIKPSFLPKDRSDFFDFIFTDFILVIFTGFILGLLTFFMVSKFRTRTR